MAWAQIGNLRGPQGPAGVGVTYRGNVADAAALPTEPPTIPVGDMYITLDDGHAHIWNGTTFQDVGPWLGPEGPTGPAGNRGSLWFSGTNTVIELNTTNPIAGVRANDHYLNVANGDVFAFS